MTISYQLNNVSIIETLCLCIKIITMDVDKFCAVLINKKVAAYAILRSKRIIEVGFKILKCSTVEEVMSKLDVVYDKIEVRAGWKVPSSRTEYFATLRNALEYFPLLKAKVPKELMIKLNKRNNRRKRVVDDEEEDTNKDDDVVYQSQKKIKLVSMNEMPHKEETVVITTEKKNDVSDKTSNSYEVSMHDSLWKFSFIRKENTEDVVFHNRSQNVKFNVHDEDGIKKYVVRILETQLSEAYKIDTIIKCKLNFGQDHMSQLTIHQATKDIRQVAYHVWTEMVEPFYKVAMIA